VILRRALAMAGCCALLASCSGGGSTTTPASTATPVASPTATATGAGSTAFAVSSVPSGLQISYSNGFETLPAGTPITLSPPLGNTAFAITFVPTNGNAVYTFVGDQRNDGLRPVLYNQVADTSGAIASIATSSIARRAAQATASVRARIDVSMRDEPRRFSRGALGRPASSATRVVVRVRANAFHDADVRARGRTIGPIRDGIETIALDAPHGVDARTYAARLRANADVVDAKPDVLDYLESTSPVSVDDTHYNDYEQWSMFEVGAPNAWGYSTGSASIPIAIVDTGADMMHPDLTGAKIVYAESDVNGVTTVGAAAAQDVDGHGTNVAGIAAADTNNAFGFAGIGYNTSLQIYKVFADDSAGNGYAASAAGSDVALGIYDAIANGARVINLSLGSCNAQGFDTTQQAAVESAIAHGVVVVAAAGNERTGASANPLCAGNNSTLDFPAAFDGVISVGASALDDSANPEVLAGAREYVAPYSNAGPGLSLVAPGGSPSTAEANGSQAPDLLHWIDGLYTTTNANPSAACKIPTDCKALFAGTSQAAPHVSGAAALLLAVDPHLSVAHVRSLLLSNADDIGDPLQGSGRLNVYRALAALEADPTQPARPTNHNFVAFAYAPNGRTTPNILDVTYSTGVPVASDGTFRIADIPAGAPPYKIGVWYDANGDGMVDAGDYFGSSALCNVNARCASAASITVAPVVSGAAPP
jgi:subtilisin family serine protease